MRKLTTLLVVLPATLLVTTVFALQGAQKSNTVTEIERIPYEAKYVFNRDLGLGRLQKAQNGVDGEVRREYLLTIERGKIVRMQLLKEETIEPLHAVFHMGRPSTRAVSRGTYTRSSTVVMEATAYTPDAGRRSPTYRTATGTRAEYGVIAVDPKVIPFGTLMYVEGYGFGIAEDTGSAIKGNRIDVCFDVLDRAMAFGRKQVQVHIFRKRIEVPVESEGSGNSSTASG